MLMKKSNTVTVTILLLSLLLLMGAYTIYNTSDLLLNDHAIEKHSTDAALALNHVASLDNPEYCKWNCKDGRERYICKIEDNRWAIVVLEAGNVVTSFVAERAYAKSIIDNGCNNPWRYQHP